MWAMFSGQESGVRYGGRPLSAADT